MSTLARRIAPAAALGGVAIAVVGLIDPAFAGSPSTAAEPVTGAQSAPQAVSAQGESIAPEQSTAQDAPASSDEGSSTDAAPASCGDNAQTVTGQSVMTRWGAVQVQASVANGQLCQAQAVAWPANDGRSQMINSYAIPQLDAMASQQGTAFDNISGATYTSEGYRQSLQSILDSL